MHVFSKSILNDIKGCVKTGHHELKVRVQARQNTGADSTFVSNSYSQAESQESFNSNEEVTPATAIAESEVDHESGESGAVDLGNIRCSCKNTSIDLLMLTW